MPLTKEQYQALAVSLSETCNNVSDVAMKRYGHAWTDDDFDKLKEVAFIFQCDDCKEWKSTYDECDKNDGLCTDCSVLFEE